MTDPKISKTALALQPMPDQTKDALGVVSPYQNMIRKKAAGIGSTSPTTEEQEEAGKLLDRINYQRALQAINRRKY